MVKQLSYFFRMLLKLAHKQLKDVAGGTLVGSDFEKRDYYSCPKCRSENIVEVMHSQRDGWILNRCCNCGHNWTVLANQIVW